MPHTNATEVPDRRSAAGLVSVDGRSFPLAATRVTARAEGGLALTVLSQSYTNPYAEPLEIRYTMPLPADGAVVAYAILLGDRRVTGRIEPRSTALADYRKALEEGRTAGLLDQERADTFTQSLGNLPAGAPVRVEIEVLHPLAYLPPTMDSGIRIGDAGSDFGDPASTESHGSGERSLRAVERGAHGSGAETRPALWEYRFPTVVGVRYEGVPGRVPDGGALDAPRAEGAGTPVRLEAELILGDGSAERIDPGSPSHDLTLSADGEGTRVSLATPSRLDRDLVVRWSAAESAVGVRLTEGDGLAGDEGRYGVVTVTPPARSVPVFARDLTILLDASGSMTGQPIEQAREIVEALLGSLGERDRFEVLAFSQSVRSLTDGLAPATSRALAGALERLREVRASGGTEMRSAIEYAMRSLRADTQRQLVLVTDGQIGFESEIVQKILENLPQNCRLHTVGVGSAPNRSLTRAAARAGRGVELLVGPRDAASGAAGRLVAATAAPVLTEIEVRGSAVLGAAPVRPRDLFSAQPAIVALVLRPEGGEIEIVGRLAGQEGPWVERIEVPPMSPALEGPRVASESACGDTDLRPERAEDPHEAIAAPPRQRLRLPLGAYYGRERVEDAEMRLAARRSERGDTFLDQIESLGMRHRIVTRRTSLVAISENPSVDPRDPRRRERLAVELPYGVSAEGVGLAPAMQLSRTLGQSLAAFGGPAGSGTSTGSWAPAESRAPTIRAKFDLLFRRRGKTEPKAGETEPIDAGAPPEEILGSFQGPIEILGEAAGPEEIPGQILRFADGSLVLIELMTPPAGLTIPGGSEIVTLVWADGAETDSLLVETLSTRPGVCGPGLVVRLAVRLAADGRRGDELAAVRWEGARGSTVLIRVRRG